MKSKNSLALALLCITLLIAYSARGQENFLLKSATASIQGTSSLHDWESEITKIECKAQFQRNSQVLMNIKSAEVKILVAGIKSTKGNMMDNKTYDAFKYKKNPYILYTLTIGQIKVDGAGNATMEASGNLTMAGIAKPVTLTAKGKVLSNGDIQLSVSRKLKMTDYKMEPPTAMMGTITVGDEVTVNFDLMLTPSGEQAKKL